MNSIKNILLKLPEYYLIILVFLSFYNPPLHVNPIGIGLISILILQIIFKNKISGLLISTIFILINLILPLALISEFNDFPTINSDAIQLLVVGLLLLSLNILMSGMMLIKYVRNN
ncbi:hypothetical protein DMA11_21090 [Marinilabiliaceae bacterium JC017]|nr:hypothetical protein DMA11_21090 [Marinilabiliaceae bacterium JC017]